MFFKRKGDLVRQNDGTLLMEGEWYDSADEANDEDGRAWLIDQIRLPISDPKHATVELIEEQIAKQAEFHAPMRSQQLAPDSLDAALPGAVRAVFGRNQAVDANAIHERVTKRRNEKRGRT
jgi:hypothetical protein